MVAFILFLLFGITVFSLSLVGYKKFKATALYALAIGGVVNANFFHAGAYPVDCFGLPFGIDSLIYTLFAFCVMVTLLHETKKSAYLLAASSIIAILFSACMQLVAELFTLGSTSEVWKTFATFLISAGASVIAVIVAVEIIDRLQGKCNVYLRMMIGIVMITVLNSCIYCPLTMLINTLPDQIWLYLAASFIGKLIALGYSVLTLFFMEQKEKRLKKEQINNK